MGNLDDLRGDPTLAAMHKAVEQRSAAEKPRKYLGASGLGHSCERMLWYGLQGTPSKPIEAKGCYAIEDGHRSEDLIADRLRMVPGIMLWTIDDKGGQFGFTDFDGKFRGHIDGVITGLYQSPKTPHIWEAKSCNEKKFKLFQDSINKYGEKGALQHWDYTYFIQAQLYMGYFDLTRHYLTVCTPGGRDIDSCRTEFNQKIYEASRNKAKRILDAKEAPVRLSDDPTYYQCKFCRYKETCHG